MRVKSAVDFRNEILIIFSIIFMSVGTLYVCLTMDFSVQMSIIGFLSAMLASSFLLWFLFGTYYELRRDCLYCRCGPFSEVIRYDDIVYLGFVNNTQSSLAMSSKRIDIRRYEDGFIHETLISPKNREAFIARLKARCPYLENAA